MIVSQVIGGLGNQMFQYAVGRTLTLERGVPLRLDICGFANYALHQGFELPSIFNCVPDIATKEDIQKILGWRSSSIFRKMLVRPRAAMFRGSQFVVEPYFDYWSEINDVPRDCYLTGYWQSEKYFQAAASVIRNDFSFKSPLVNRNAELAEDIAKGNAVSLHVRRGDYAKNKKTNATHGLCSLDYYRAAIRYVSGRVKSPYFFIFSDDIAWVKDNLKMDFPCQFVDHNQGAESYNDMRLMSLCRHHIIANSSFSWWGAWLNPRTDKVVVAPQKWFVNNNDVKDLFPLNWVPL